MHHLVYTQPDRETRDTSACVLYSYYVQPEDKSVIAATTEYGLRFTSVLWRDNLFACRFHPEKSQALGLQLLKNFASLT